LSIGGMSKGPKTKTRSTRTTYCSGLTGYELKMNVVCLCKTGGPPREVTYILSAFIAHRLRAANIRPQKIPVHSLLGKILSMHFRRPFVTEQSLSLFPLGTAVPTVRLIRRQPQVEWVLRFVVGDSPG
jgi:hypothetical protein